MASLAIGMLAFSLSAVAQDVMLKINTTVGEGRPQASEHKIAAGTETAIHTDSMYRVMVKPTVVSATNVQLSFKVVDVASGETVSAPSILARVGQKASVAQGTEAPNPRNLHIDVTPSL
jgi:hypothetical protein